MYSFNSMDVGSDSMALFFKRQRQARGEVPDVYQYDELPSNLRVQFCHIVEDVLEKPHGEMSELAYRVPDMAECVVNLMCREIGIFSLLSQPPVSGYGNRLYTTELMDFILQEADVELVLTAIEMMCKFLEPESRFIAELNLRFREHGVGYQFEGELIRIDSQYVHKEAVKPALSILSGKAYQGPQEEFLSAHKHYRNGDLQEALVDALKAFESTIKVICDKRKWTYGKNDPVKKLLKVCFDNDLIPAFWQSHMSGLRSTLESGVPTVRNKMGGHGQGAKVVNVPGHIAAYALHLTASTIVLLVKAEQDL